MNDKIQPHHRDRAAYVYVRQSTGHQVRHNHQGRERQYDLAALARELAFSRVVVIDEDQGKTGSGLVARPGFQALLAAVCGNQVGAVFALEASRLARNNHDWHHLIDLCALTGTLIVDADGTYDPRHLNDRLLLGLKGTMSEFELGLFRQRARAAFEMKIKRGHAMWEMPVGLSRNDDDRIEKIADRQAQAAIEGIFRKFRELGTARQVTLWYRDQNLPIPEVVPATRGREVVWRLPRGRRINQILKNPLYAGALAYGRTEAIMTVEDGRARKSLSRARTPLGKWKILILDNHPGYISWEEFLENQTMLEANLRQVAITGKGAAKNGSALLAGLLRCGHCGRKMFVTYSGGGRSPRHLCQGDRANRGNSPCQKFTATSVERAVIDSVMAAIRPAGIQAAMDALERIDRREDEKRKALELSLEKARYEVDRARRQYELVDPANRLVAGELESRWNMAMQRAAQLESECLQCDRQAPALTGDERRRLLELGRDLPSLWEHPSSSASLKKRVLRTIIEEIIVGDDAERKNHLLTVHWKGGVHSEMKVPRNTTGKKLHDTESTALELIEELSKVCDDRSLAAHLNRLGYQTGASKTWRIHSIQNARCYHRLMNHHNTGEWLTVEQAAGETLVSYTVIRRLISEGILPAKQVVRTTPWIIERASLSLQLVRDAIAAVKQGRQLPKTDPRQVEFPL